MAIPVAILGDLNWDLVLAVDELPARGQEARAERSSFRLGGSATNTARWLSRLGFAARLLVAVGEDPLGDLALQKLVQDGIPPHFIQRHPETTGLCLALVDRSGERTLLTWRGANALLSLPLPENWLRGARWLHLSGYALLERSSREALHAALRWARDLAVPGSFDPGMVAVHGHVRFLSALGPVDVFLPNQEEALALVGGLSPGELARLKRFG
ncbi:MAG: carbohydrate kinase family protein, partial [Candidatus Bipolaricaulaceae bacterium]